MCRTMQSGNQGDWEYMEVVVWKIIFACRFIYVTCVYAAVDTYLIGCLLKCILPFILVSNSTSFIQLTVLYLLFKAIDVHFLLL